jgi:hypothetical protein
MPVIINPYALTLMGPEPFWNPSDKASNITLSNGDLTAQSASASTGAVRSTNSVGAEARYVEIVADDTNAGSFRWRVGFATSGFNVTFDPGSTSTSWVLEGSGDKFHNGSFEALGSAISAADIVMLARDAAGAVWFGANGTWFGGGDPAAGTSPAYTGLTGSIFLLFGSAPVTGTMQASIKPNGTYTYAAPGGFARGW